MDDRLLYLKDLQSFPEVMSSINAAKKNPTKTATVSFSQFYDDAFALYAAVGLANLDGVSVLIRSDHPAE